MLKILIVDDEEDEREVIRFLLNKYGFQMEIQTAANGLEALNMLKAKEPDILFTDVRMPFLMGTELAVRARELYPRLQILFFSGFDDFEYAKKALSVGAIDYILKPIHPEEFRKTMEAAVSRVGKQEEESLYRRGHILSLLLGGSRVEFLRDKFGDVEFLQEFVRMILMQFDTPVFDTEFSEDEDGGKLDRVVGKALEEQEFYTLNLNPRQAVVLLKDGTGCVAAGQTELASEALQRLMSAAFHRPCFLAVSPVFSSPDEICTAFSQAEQMLMDRFFYPETYIYPVTDLQSPESQNPIQDTVLIKAVEQAIRDQDIRGFSRGLDILFEKYGEKKEPSQIYIRYLFSQLAELLCRALPSPASIQETVEQVYTCRNVSEIRTYISGLAKEVSQTFDHSADTPHHTIQIVKQHIKEHYAEDLSLERLAEVAYLSPRYLSDLFIRQTGCGINKYVKTLRMEKAGTMLLTTNKKVQDICLEVGYTNFSYFCRSFRDHFGSSPEGYRQSANTPANSLGGAH